MELGEALADALGIRGKPWTRIVIVADVNDAAQVYVKGLVPSVAVPGIVRAVQDVTVDDNGDVAVIVLGESP